jgi:DNA-binding CsgD family transcriptional regulator
MAEQPSRGAHSSSDPDRDGEQRQHFLTQRESDVLVRVQRGLQNKTIAYELGMAEQSVKEYVSVMLRKFGVSNRTALAAAASRLEITGQLGTDRTWLPQFFRGAEPQICVVRGPDLRFEAVSDSFRQAVGDRPLIGRTMREAFPELEGQTIWERVERVYATGFAEIEHEAVRFWDRGHGIERRLVDLVIQPLRDEDGAVNGVMSFAVDVTDLVGPDHGAELVREEFAAVLDLVPSGVVIADETGEIVKMNAAAERIARFAVDPARPLSRALRGEVVAEEVEALIGGDPARRVRIRATAQPLHAPDGQIRGAIAVLTEL